MCKNRYIIFLLSIFVIYTYPNFSLGCTLCHSERSELVRAYVFGANFLLNIGITLLPFVIFIVIIAGIYYYWPIQSN